MTKKTELVPCPLCGGDEGYTVDPLDCRLIDLHCGACKSLVVWHAEDIGLDSDAEWNRASTHAKSKEVRWMNKDRIKHSKEIKEKLRLLALGAKYEWECPDISGQGLLLSAVRTEFNLDRESLMKVMNAIDQWYTIDELTIVVYRIIGLQQD